MFKSIFNKIFSNTYICISLIIIFSLILSLYHSINIDQRALDEALIISNKIFYDDEFNVLNLGFNNSLTITPQILKIFIELDIGIKILNFFILLVAILLNSFGIYFISKSLTKNNFFSIILLTIILLLQINFGDLDYPTIFIKEHTHSMLGSAIFVFVFGLIANQKISYAIIISIFSLSLHLTIGAWLCFIVFLSVIFFNKKPLKFYFNSKKKTFLLILSFAIILCSFIFIQLNKIEIPFTYDEKLYNIYSEVWEHHRVSKRFGINYNYIIFSFVLLSFLGLLKKENNNLNFFCNAVIIHLIISFSIYIIYKMFPNIFHGIFLRVIPSRFFLLHSIIGPVIIFSSIFFYYKKFFKSYNLIILFLILSLIHPALYYEKYFKRINSIVNKWKNIYLVDNSFWNEIKKEDTGNGVILTSVDACSDTIQKSQKPILLCIESIDVIPYIPKLVVPIKEIITDVYKIDFSNPPLKNMGGIIYDKYYKNTFENRSLEEWYSISNKFNLSALILPKNWNINLEKEIVGKDFIYYKF